MYEKLTKLKYLDWHYLGSRIALQARYSVKIAKVLKYLNVVVSVLNVLKYSMTCSRVIGRLVFVVDSVENIVIYFE